ncbi:MULTISPECIES: hypothetical protein [unclassified Halomonas]|nr:MULTISPECIES: hypothetical protein [unclassified Halomonas]
MKYQEQFLTIWDTPAAQTNRQAKAAKPRVSLFKSLSLMLVALKR